MESALLAAAKPEAIYRVMDIADIKVQGFSLKKHLAGVSQGHRDGAHSRYRNGQSDKKAAGH